MKTAHCVPETAMPKDLPVRKGFAVSLLRSLFQEPLFTCGKNLP